MRQNVTDGTKGAFGLFEEYQKEYSEKMARMKDKKSQFLEQWEMEQAEGFANFTKSKLYINPTNGQVSVGKMVRNDETGVMELSKNPNDFSTVNQMRNRLKSKYDRIDVDGTLNQWVKGLGKYQEVVRAAGGWKTISNPQLRDKKDPKTKQMINEFDKAMNGMLEAQFAGNPYNATSVLTDYLGMDMNGQEYTFTYDEADAAANPNKILLKPDPVNPGGAYLPDFSTANGKKQKEVALQYMREQTIVKLERQEQFQQGPQAQQWQYQVGQDRKQQQNMANMLGKLYSGTDAEVQTAMDYFKNLPGVQGINRQGDKVTLTIKDKDGNTVTRDVNFKTSTGELVGTEGFIQAGTSLFLGAAADPKIASETAIATKGRGFNEQYTGSSTVTVSDTQDPMKQYAAAVESKAQGLMSGDWDEESVAEDVNNQFGGIGFSARVPYTYGDYIEITSPDGKKSPEIDLSKPNAKQVIADFIKGNIQGATAKEKMRNAYQIISTGTLGGGTQGGTPAAGDAIFGQ
jgi:hypothetical protein